MSQTNPNLEPQGDALDTRLKGFFRSQMPQPWPTCPVAAETTIAQPENGWFTGARLALAASILACFLGYLALSSVFPRDHGKTFPSNHQQDIGMKPKSK